MSKKEKASFFLSFSVENNTNKTMSLISPTKKIVAVLFPPKKSYCLYIKKSLIHLGEIWAILFWCAVTNNKWNY